MATTSTPISTTTPDERDLGRVVRALATWQRDGGAVQLHPGDLGWYHRHGARRAAAMVRTWHHAGELFGVALVDDGVMRLGLAPQGAADETLMRELVDTLADLSTVEARSGDVLRRLLHAGGWAWDEPWTPLDLDLDQRPAEPAAPVDLRVVTVRADGAPKTIADRVAVQLAAFATSTLTVDAWHAMAAGPAYAGIDGSADGQARCLVGYDEHDAAVAAVTVWSAGPGRPGLLEPVGVHRDHRGRGYGTAISRAGAAALHELGASHATVCTPSANRAAVATYVAAGFTAQPESRDLRRPGRR